MSSFVTDTISTMTSKIYSAKRRIEKMKLPVKERAFKDKFSFTQRLSESAKIIAKYPDRIPVICERIGDTVPDIDRKKYLVPGDLSIANFMYVIRKRIKLSPEVSIFLFVNESMVPCSELMSKCYEDHKDDDGFLYIKYSGESTFG
uniref:Autophagy-related protein n=1 Tax=viral metagenome TaxID=1070528 RepID=A0A6C0CQA6_9ZZZZ